MSIRTLRKLSSCERVTTEFFLRTCNLTDVALHKEEIGASRPIVAANDQANLYDALKHMKEENVKKIVIYRIDKKTGKKVYTSIVTSIDILNWFVWKTKLSDSSEIKISEFSGITEESKNLWVYPSSIHLDSVVQPFIQGVHALIVRQKKRHPGKLFISQWDVVSFMYSKRDFIVEAKEFFKSSLKDSDIISRLQKVLTIKDTAPVKEGFEIIVNKAIGGIAVINEAGILVSNLCSGLAHELFNEEKENLLESQTVAEFLKASGVPFGPKVPINWVTEKSTNEEVMKLVVEKHLHRVWVSDSDGRPLYALTLSDIIREVVLFDFFKQSDSDSA